MGPIETQQPKVELKRFDKVSYNLKKVVNSYFERPLHYTLYSGLFLAMVGFFVNYRPMLEFYLLMGVLTGLEAYKYWVKRNEDVQPR